MPMLILSFTFSISACGKTTSEKAAEKAQKELGLSDDEAAELKEVYDDAFKYQTTLEELEYYYSFNNNYVKSLPYAKSYS